MVVRRGALLILGVQVGVAQARLWALRHACWCRRSITTVGMLEAAIECKWRGSTAFILFLDSSLTGSTGCEGTSEDSDVEPTEPRLVEGTIARLFMFGSRWREGLNRSPHGKVEYNARRDSCYGTLDLWFPNCSPPWRRWKPTGAH